jgi:Mn2+/Fe2+ NRAMP family transporter
MREEKIKGAESLRYVRTDLMVAYGVTAVLAVAVMIMANRAFFVTGVELNADNAVPQMAAMLGTTVGPLGSLAYSIGFWGATLSSLLGVWQGVPYMFADMYGILRRYTREDRDQLTQVTSTPYRIALVAMTLIPIPFAFLDRPLFLLITYTVVGSLFIPFLAATLLYMNNRVAWASPVKRNGWGSNVVLVLILVFFATIGIRDILSAF